METESKQQIIELDGPTHNYKSRRERDEFIDDLAKIINLPILHLKTNNLNKELVRREINQKLKN